MEDASLLPAPGNEDLTIFIRALRFANNTTLNIERDSVVVIVGPNNSGKTSTLRGIYTALESETPSATISSLDLAKTGTVDSLTLWLKQNTTLLRKNSWGRTAYSWLGHEIEIGDIYRAWSGDKLRELAPIICSELTVEERLKVVEPAEVKDFAIEAPACPIHVLYRNDKIELAASEYFKLAFQNDIVLNRGVGKYLPLHYGTRPVLDPDEDRVSPSYLAKLEGLPLLNLQGHGLRGFAGCILHTLASPAFVQLIDEPEAFLHPPQARLLGQLLVSRKPEFRQLFVATHSSDFLRGVLDVQGDKVQVVRLSRHSDKTDVCVLAPSDVRKLWSDPILRYSNVLDGLFHESVIVCESDGDCRFYNSVLDAITGGSRIGGDVMFTSSGGKQRIAVIARSLQSLGVKTAAIVDFDILRSKSDLRTLVEALNGDWSSLQDEWNLVYKSLEQRSPPLNLGQVRNSINALIDAQADSRLYDKTAEEIRAVLKSASPWQTAKMAGFKILPSGDASRAMLTLDEKLNQLGIFIVPCGELERFAPTVPGHGPAWVFEVLQKNLAEDPELEDARAFVQRVTKSERLPPAKNRLVPKPADPPDQRERFEVSVRSTYSVGSPDAVVEAKEKEISKPGAVARVFIMIRRLIFPS